MVAIAVFSVVMVAAMSALLNVIDANNKARAIKTAINNVNFALEGISKDMRMGTNYVCGTDFNSIPNSAGCSTAGGSIIGYKSNRADDGKYAYYRYNGDNLKLEECLEKNDKICTSNPDDFSPITSSEVKIEKAVFYVLGVDDPTKQPRMIITIKGKAGPSSKENLQTTFDLQTSVSQRIRKTTP